MSIEEIAKLLDKIVKDDYIDCGNSDYDNNQFQQITIALSKCLLLDKKYNELEASYNILTNDKERIENILNHLLKSHVICEYSELNATDDEYIKNINELDSYIKLCNEIVCPKVANDKSIDRLGDFKVVRNKNFIELVYDPIVKPIEIQMTIVENKSNDECPICHQELGQYPAISRKDNKTKICSNCGMLEALEAFNNLLKDAKKNE